VPARRGWGARGGKGLRSADTFDYTSSSVTAKLCSNASSQVSGCVGPGHIQGPMPGGYCCSGCAGDVAVH
jgi:hypothetical protein